MSDPVVSPAASPTSLSVPDDDTSSQYSQDLDYISSDEEDPESESAPFHAGAVFPWEERRARNKDRHERRKRKSKQDKRKSSSSSLQAEAFSVSSTTQTGPSTPRGSGGIAPPSLRNRPMVKFTEDASRSAFESQRPSNPPPDRPSDARPPPPPRPPRLDETKLSLFPKPSHTAPLALKKQASFAFGSKQVWPRVSIDQIDGHVLISRPSLPIPRPTTPVDQINTDDDIVAQSRWSPDTPDKGQKLRSIFSLKKLRPRQSAINLRIHTKTPSRKEREKENEAPTYNTLPQLQPIFGLSEILIHPPPPTHSLPPPPSKDTPPFPTFAQNLPRQQTGPIQVFQHRPLRSKMSLSKFSFIKKRDNKEKRSSKEKEARVDHVGKRNSKDKENGPDSMRKSNSYDEQAPYNLMMPRSYDLYASFQRCFSYPFERFSIDLI